MLVVAYFTFPGVRGLLSLALVLLIVGAALVALIVTFMARVLLSPPRMDDAKAAWLLKRLSPGDLDLHFEPITYCVLDERTAQKLKIAAWWIPHEKAAGRCVVVIHGYADAKVGAIAWAPTFHALGVNLLVLDLRAHGESEGRYTTGGYFERQDVSQLIDQLRAERPDQTRRLAIFGVSLGAAVSAATVVWRAEEQHLRDIDAVILECPFSDYRVAIRAHAHVLGMPGERLVQAAIRIAEKRSGADYNAVRPADLIRRIPCPLMVIRSDADLFVTHADAEIVEAAVTQRAAEHGPTVYWQAENAHHVAALYEDPLVYRQRIGEFLESVWGTERGCGSADSIEGSALADAAGAIAATASAKVDPTKLRSQD